MQWHRVLLSLLGAVIVVATVEEAWAMYITVSGDRQQLKANRLTQCLRCFSVITNGRQLMSTKMASSDNLACLNGIRVLSTTWIVLYHTYFEATLSVFVNLNVMIEVLTKLPMPTFAIYTFVM